MPSDLFSYQLEERLKKEAPLAARMRPETLDEFVGQEHLVGEGKVLRRAAEGGQLPSMILWGPPGSGKTSLAYILAKSTGAHFSHLSAVSAGVSDLRQVVQESEERRKLSGQKSILFIDEIHRFNKAQQDAILPYVENGIITLIGATTENPSFEVISPLLSRARVFALRPLSTEEVGIIIKRALEDKERGLGAFDIELDREAFNFLVQMADGDARVALNALEIAFMTVPPDSSGKRKIGLPDIENAIQQRSLIYDKNGEQHYDLISALHKSIRGSDPDGALYWLARMLEAGEDPLYIARRVVRAASEDIGLADPQALVIAMSAQQAVNFIGMPEGNLALAQAVVYLATAPKSNSLYLAYTEVQDEIKKTGSLPVPLHIRNPVTSLMASLGYGQGYKYAHNFPGHFVPQQYLPTSLIGKHFYKPSDQGYEIEVGRRLANWWGRKVPQKE